MATLMGTHSLTLPRPLMSPSHPLSRNHKAHELWLIPCNNTTNNSAVMTMAAAAPKPPSAAPGTSRGFTTAAVSVNMKATKRPISPPPFPSPSPSPVDSQTESPNPPVCTRRWTTSLLLSPILLLPLSSTSAALLGSGVAGSPTSMTARAAEEGRKGPAFKEMEGGVRVLDVRVGTGAEPEMGQRVSVHYVGRLAAKQGWRFDSTYEHLDGRGDPVPFEFELGAQEVIAGLSIAVAGMRVGGIRRAVIPPPLSYRTTDDQPLPPNFSSRQRLFTTVFNPTRIANGEGNFLATVVFDIELVAVRPSSS